MIKGNVSKITKKEMREYDAQVRKRAKKFKLKPPDFHNLYDLYWMADKNLWEVLKLNKMDDWFRDFTYRIERILFTEDFAIEKSKKKVSK